MLMAMDVLVWKICMSLWRSKKLEWPITTTHRLRILKKSVACFFLLQTITNNAIHDCDKCRVEHNVCRLRERKIKTQKKQQTQYINSATLLMTSAKVKIKETTTTIKTTRNLRGLFTCILDQYVITKQIRINFIFWTIKLCRRMKTK